MAELIHRAITSPGVPVVEVEYAVRQVEETADDDIRVTGTDLALVAARRFGNGVVHLHHRMRRVA